MRRVRPLGRAARREWGPLWAAVRTAVATERLRAVPMTLAAVCLTALLQVVQNRSWGYGPVQALGAVRADDPLWAALLRTPLSLFVPALDLPVWGALAQVLLVFGIAEICLGRWRTLLIAYVATLAGTLYARIGVAVGPDGFPGLPGSDAQVVDTGPSAAVVALAVCVCFAYRARFTGGLVIVAMVVEVAVKDNLAGREHLAAIAAALVLCAVPALRGRCRQGLGERAGTRSGAPPIRSWNLRRGPAQRTSWW
ncbi:hypothetical protein P8A21_10425 [Streptomyces poriferorum]|uniref:Integral membrane protein n=1 Tax=Streptomyces poriferorum TaxID=2798799 RepID=A0ABY9IVE9_9ACTN|nr:MULTISPECIES: hypothetical protein [unclassified Streptomyces]MDP5311482.1 hypothetical protein [Streptomyces sp. Alt4]WLQ47890.1 hypothetical protein P8A21_10425 [Streptomyces sp. Alt1]WLQ59423.1 hypothetical protein P8A19_30145 [Streptomyces sp. Alt2]WSI62708.1 hypothetical protein OG471_11790 [Streptomyces sp. NBC_01336]